MGLLEYSTLAVNCLVCVRDYIILVHGEQRSFKLFEFVYAGGQKNSMMCRNATEKKVINMCRKRL